MNNNVPDYTKGMLWAKIKIVVAEGVVADGKNAMQRTIRSSYGDM